MKANQMLGLHRILLVFCGIALLLVNYFPIWRIELDAPQYPEGLELLIFSNKLAGNVDIINGLNHYIGMKTLHTNDFIEFSVLPYLVIFFAVAFVLAGVWGKRWSGYTVLVLFAMFGVASMVDFWLWEYDYGHNLSPDAAIKVPGMSYQPPLIGFKQLLNFGAYSIPAAGGWIFIMTGVVAAYCMVSEWLATRKVLTISHTARLVLSTLTLYAGLSIAQSCGPRCAEPIRAGVDACAHCKMTISDLRFGCEFISKKGRAFKFDDLQCMSSFVKQDGVSKAEIETFYLPDFTTNELSEAHQMHILHSEDLRSPMGGNYATFKMQADLKNAQDKFPGEVVKWEKLIR